jgi:hypothetical protein
MQRPSLPGGARLFDIFLVVSAIVIMTAFYLS